MSTGEPVYPAMLDDRRVVALRHLVDASDWWVSCGVLFVSSDRDGLVPIDEPLTDDEKAAMVALAEWMGTFEEDVR